MREGMAMMTEVYSIDSRSSFEALAEGFDGFHDRVVQELGVFACDPEAVAILYDAELILRDPYKRFGSTRIRFDFESVNLASVRGLFELQSELTALNLERISGGIRVSADGDYLTIEAGRATFCILS